MEHKIGRTRLTNQVAAHLQRLRPMSNDDTVVVVDYFRQLAESRADCSFETILHGLAKVVRADQVGICDPEQASRDIVAGPARLDLATYPWRANGTLLETLRESMAAEVFRDPGGQWLACLVWDPVTGATRLAW